MALAERIGQRFSDLAVPHDISQALREKWTSEFLKRYTEMHRHYHTLAHIDAMLTCLDQITIKDAAVPLAIFFHDWVYNPQGAENELESARIFEEFAGDVGLDVKLRHRVRFLIEATISHSLQEEDEGAKLFLDFDLEVLSRSKEDYGIYATQIRQEYGHFGDVEYRRGRASVLERFLQRDRIYCSNAFADREEAARQNIRAEIAILGDERNKPN